MSVRTLSIGGATYDLFVSLAKLPTDDGNPPKHLLLPLGGKVNIEHIVEACGGGACNTAVGLARLGCSACFCGLLGEDEWGKKLESTMRAEGVDLCGLTVVEREVTSFSLVLSAPGQDRVILYTPGTNRHLHDATFDRELMNTVDWVYFNRIQAGSCSIEDDIIAKLKASPNTCLTWNPGGKHIEMGLAHAHTRTLLTHTTLLLLNAEEAIAFSGAPNVHGALQTLAGAGVRYVCITDGKNGTHATDGTQAWFCPVVDAPVVDTTGAGDAFGIGATWALSQGLDLPTALRAGTMNAASVITHIGAQAGLLTDTSMRAKLSETPLAVAVSSLF